MTMGIMPITGIPLPFMSYGGSAIIASFIAIGLVANVNMRAVQLSTCRAGVRAPRRGVAGLPGYAGREMSDLWPRIEPLLARVEKPARYIGMERGSVRPHHEARRVAFLLIYPDTYEIGLPNQGLQILYEILNERPDAVAERAYAPWTDMEASMRAAGLPLFSVDTHRAAGDFDVLAFNLSAELVYTNLLNLVDLAGVPVRNEHRAPADPIVIAGGHCAYNPEPLAEYVDAFVIGDGEEVDRRDRRGRRRVEARRPRVAARRCSASSRRSPACTCRRCTTSSTTGRSSRAVAPRFPDVPAVVDKRTVADLADWPYPKQQLVPLVEVVHDRLNVEIFRGCTRGCRFCQAGHDHPPGAGAARGAGAHDGARGPAPAPATTRSRSRRCRAPTSPGIDGVVADLVNDQVGTGSVSVSLPSLRVDAFSVKIATEIQKVRRTGLDVRARGRLVAAAPGDQQADPRRGPLQRGRRRVLAGLAAGEALLPHRPADRDGRRHARDRGAREQRRRHRPPVHEAGELHGVGRRLRAQAAHAVPVVRPEQRRRAGPQDRPAARPRRRARKAQVKWHDPQATFAEGIVSRGDRRIGRVIEAVWRAGGTFQEWSEHFSLDRWLDAMRAEGLDPDWYVTRHRTRDEVLPWDHIAAGLHHDFLWDDWQAALAEHGLPDCRWTPCYDCGVCTDYALEHVVASPLAPAGGSQGTGQDLGAGGGRPGPLPRARSRAVGAHGRSRGMRGGAANPVRLRYTKRGKVRWISHRDVARALERAFRITQLPLAFTEGFSPRPKVSFGLALSTGHESDAEYLDLVFAEEVELEPLSVSLTEALPEGMAVTGAVPLVERAPALQEAVTAVVWRVEPVRADGAPIDASQLGAHVERALELPALPTSRRRKGREVEEDVLPVIRRCELQDTNPVSVEMELITQPRSAKPGDMLAGIARATDLPGGLAEAQVLRTHQWIERDGTRLEPLAADTRPRALEARAS